MGNPSVLLPERNEQQRLVPHRCASVFIARNAYGTTETRRRGVWGTSVLRQNKNNEARKSRVAAPGFRRADVRRSTRLDEARVRRPPTPGPPPPPSLLCPRLRLGLLSCARRTHVFRAWNKLTLRMDTTEGGENRASKTQPARSLVHHLPHSRKIVIFQNSAKIALFL